MKAVVVLFAAAWAIATLPSAQARPLYMRGFANEYPKIERLTRAAKCAVCHCTASKAKTNSYGAALARALDAKNVKDRELISKSIINIEKVPSSVPGKTFGDLIKEGKLPAPCPEKK